MNRLDQIRKIARMIQVGAFALVAILAVIQITIPSIFVNYPNIGTAAYTLVILAIAALLGVNGVMIFVVMHERNKK